MTLKKRGRPKSEFVARNVYLSKAQIERLRKIGRGNISAGIRYLLDRRPITLPDGL